MYVKIRLILMTCTCTTPPDLSPHMAKTEAFPTVEP